MKLHIKVQRGEYRGRKLQSPIGRDIRPMGARLRCKMMDALGDAVENATVYDICCGSGAQGIEALSVGATRVVFVDKSGDALRLARANVTGLGDSPLAASEFRRRPADRVLEDLAVSDAREGALVIFVSPPYATSETICKAACRTYAAMAAAGRTEFCLVLQHSPRVQFHLPPQYLELGLEIDRRTYATGDSQATIFRRGI